MELDKTDKKLLNLLQADARLSYAELAKRLGVSTSGIHKRVKRLVDAEVIKRFVVVVDPQAIGKKLKAFIGVSTESGRCAEVKSQLIRKPEVLEIHEVAGEHDLFLKIITDDPLKLNDILHEFDSIPGVGSTRTLIVLKTEKETNAIHIG
jgi:Lrp/AsnC family transcriptional regulator for asnA, asnC and gidA